MSIPQVENEKTSNLSISNTIHPKPLSSQTNEGFYGKLATEKLYTQNIKNLTTKI